MQHMETEFDGIIKRLRVLPDEDVEAIRRDSRKGDALKILDRLPIWLRRWEKGRLDQCKKPLVTSARAWTTHRSIVLMGPTGVGKSTVAGWLLHRLVAHGVRDGGQPWELAQGIRWFDATQLEHARAEHPLGKGQAPEVRDSCCASVLVLDDMGQEKNGKALEEVIATRYKSNLPTIVTTNLSASGLTERYGSMTVRKLRQACGGRAIIAEVS